MIALETLRPINQLSSHVSNPVNLINIILRPNRVFHNQRRHQHPLNSAGLMKSMAHELGYVKDLYNVCDLFAEW